MPKRKRQNSENLVLDSFALLLFLRKERGGTRIRALLEKAKKGKRQFYMCWLNVGEIYYKVFREYGQKGTEATLTLVRALPIQLISVDDELVLSAAKIKADYSISLADCFVVATAQRFSAKIVTGDPDFKKVEKLVDIVWVG